VSERQSWPRTGRLVRLRNWIDRCRRRGGERMFAAADARAAEYGWQVRTTRGGLGRSYRDPRFDRLVRCPDCGGSGRVGYTRQTCAWCDGSGRRLRPPAPTRTEAWW
jgi:hypothetical protein